MSNEAHVEALCDFLDLFLGDRESGRVRPIDEYLARYPGHEDAIAREFARVTDPGDRDELGARASAVARFSAAAGGRYESLVGRLAARGDVAARYEPGSEVGRGGMGSVYRAHDRDLDRTLAMKVMTSAGERKLARFLEEARITGGLDHPAIVPVHELGLDSRGRLYFTMRLVQGVDLRRAIEMARVGEGGMSRTRCLEILVKVCDAMAYAHSKGVIHRDLKPSNVMTGAFGEVYVMDWGLARALDRADVHDLRLRDAKPADSGTRRAGAYDSPLLTMDGDVVGTPSYMSPEQARGSSSELGARSDVYSVGAMLYHVLAGVPPYADRGEGSDHAAVLARVAAGPPRPIDELVRDVPRELVAICDRALARDAADRYRDMRAMAEDLRAYLDLRVVRAYRTGAAAELRKWVLRNRALALSIASTVLVVFSATLGLLASQTAARRHFEMLASVLEPIQLAAQFADLWPAVPERAPALRSWLERAESVDARRVAAERELDELRRLALPMDPDAPLENIERNRLRLHRELLERHRTYYEAEFNRLTAEGGTTHQGEDVDVVRAKYEDLSRRVADEGSIEPTQKTWRFADAARQARFDALTQFVLGCRPLCGTEESEGMIGEARRGLRFAQTVERLSIDEHASAWRRAIESIADPVECPAYGGLVIRPQLGLAPIGRDPHSGLWEFAHVLSGAIPNRGLDGELLVTEDMAIVFVLIPRALTTRGAQSAEREGTRFDADARFNESPVTLIELEPYFIAKFEVTASQWVRLAGRNPTGFVGAGALPDASTHPADSLSWSDCMHVLSQTGLRLPTEAQWEHAARGGTDTPWYWGAQRELVTSFANVFDRSAMQRGYWSLSSSAFDARIDDRWPAHARVGSFCPNPFGLFDVIGNVEEWCLDRGSTDYRMDVAWGSGECVLHGEGVHALRGGGYLSGIVAARSAARHLAGPEYADYSSGVRAARALEP